MTFTKSQRNQKILSLKLLILSQSLEFLDWWDDIFSDVNSTNKNNNFTIFGTFSKATIKHNLETISKLIPLIPPNTQPLLQVFGTRSLEGFFGEQRVYSKRTTVMEYIMKYSSLKFQYFKKECVKLPYTTGVKRKYTNEEQTDKSMDTKSFVTYLHQIKQQIETNHVPFTDNDCARAEHLQLLCVKYRVNSIRQTYHQLSYNNNNSDAITFTPQMPRFNRQSLAQFTISTPRPLEFSQIQSREMEGVRLSFIMTHDSLYHIESGLPVFKLSSKIELEIFGLPFIETDYSPKVAILNSPKKQGNSYTELPLSVAFFSIPSSQTHRLVCDISSSTIN